MEKRQLADGCGVFVNGEWQVKNLKFLTEFMRQTGLTTGDVAKAVGLLRNSVTRWLMVDDTNLSKVIKVAEYFGYDFIISYTVPMNEIAGTNLTIETPVSPVKEHVKRTDFVREAMRKACITNKELAQKLGVIRNTIQLWFRKDDISIRYIYEIAEAYGWKVNITFRLKEIN